MKYTNYFLLILFLPFLSCKKSNLDDNNPIVVSPSSVVDTPDPLELKEGVTIPTNDLKRLIPSNYKKSHFAIYKKLDGTELKFKIDFKDFVKIDRERSRVKYFSDQFYAVLYADEIDYVLAVQGNASFESADKITKWITYNVVAKKTSVSGHAIMGMDKQLDKEEPFNRYTPQKEYNGKMFKDIFFTKAVNLKNYSEVVYNTTFGIVAYRDEKDEYVVFDRFE